MPQKGLSMRKIKEVLRLRFAASLNQEQIARSCSISQSSVHRYLKMAAAAGLEWPLPEEYDDRQLNELLFPSHPDLSPPDGRAGADYAEVHRELKSHRHLTLQLIWEEYRQNQPDGYGYSRFCELYQRWIRNHNVVNWQEHHPGEKMFVDLSEPGLRNLV